MALLASGTETPASGSVFELNIGDSVRVRTRDGREHAVRLIGVHERTEPYYESANNKLIDAIVSADVSLNIDGVSQSFTGGPLRMPAHLVGLAFLLGCTRHWSGGIIKDSLAKDIRLEIQDASLPWVQPDKFIFPIRNYRWRAVNYQHTYLGVAVNQARLYYHRGEDMGMIPDLDLSLAMEALQVVSVPGVTGDGLSNSVTLRDGTGLCFRYAHMNTPHIFADLQPGVEMAQGQPLGLTGNTWQGSPVRDPHLHVEAHEHDLAGPFRNTFPL
jgi:hypothetical protein